MPERHAAFGRLLLQHLQGTKIEGPVHRREHPGYGARMLQSTQDQPLVGPVYDDGSPVIPQMEVFGPLAVIPVQGVLGKGMSCLDLMCGGCDYSHIAQFIELAKANPAVQTVIFDIDSPGGSAQGAPECASVVADLAASKDTIAFTDDCCCSAAYFLASQCGEIAATNTAIVGSIGTVLAAQDTSREWEMKGIKLELFTSSPLKAAGMDGKPWTDADRAFFTERMNQADSWIKGSVRNGRPQIAEEALQGQWFYAQFALQLGVVDVLVSSIDDVVAAAFGVN